MSGTPPEDGFRIRRATAADLAALTDIAFAAKRHWGYPEAWIQAWSPVLTATPALLREQIVWLAENSAGPAGWIALLDQTSHWSVDHLWVRPESHGRGCGRLLFETLRSEVRQRRCRLLRIESDPFAVPVYQRFGAVQIGWADAPVLGEARQLPLLELTIDPEPFERRRGPWLVSDDPARLDRERVHGWLTRSYWSPGVPAGVLDRAIRNSVWMALYDANGVQGFARMATDRATYGYLCDVYVAPEMRGRGHVTWLVESLLAHPALQALRRIGLVTRDAHAVYAKLGFTPLAHPARHMERVRPTAELYGPPPPDADR